MSTDHEAREALHRLRITDVTHTVSTKENIDELVLTMEDGSKVVIAISPGALRSGHLVSKLDLALIK